MPTLRTRRLARTAALSALTVALIAAPTAALGKTRVVDNDGKGTPTNCNASTSTFTSIQKAVTASGPADIVKVCPGTYVGKVRITGDRDGLTLVSTMAMGATIKDPSVYQITPTALVRIEEVSGVTVKGFKVRTLSVETYDTQTMDGILASAASNVTIRGNDVGWVGDAGDRSQLRTGILFTDRTTGLIINNTVIDALDDSIHATGSGTDVTIQGNTLKAVFAGLTHAADDAVEIRTGATARVRANTITAGPGTAPALSKFAAGVELYNAGSATYVEDNSITDPVRGIETRGDGYSLYDNVIVARQVGISLVSTSNGEVIGNTARATRSIGYGISALEASNNNQISANDVRDSFGPDCHEQQSNSDGINNAWSDNLTDSTNDADPDGLCDEADVPA